MKRLVLLGMLLVGYCSILFAGSYHFVVRVIGNGRPMILIPGLNSPGELWNTTVNHFKDRYTCYVITLAGFAGQPPSGRKDSLVYLQKDDIIRFIKDKKLHKPVLAGFSFGGNFALWLACTNPELFGPVIDIDGLAFDDSFFAPGKTNDSIKRANKIKYDTLVNKGDDYWAARYTKRYLPQSIAFGNKYLEDLVTDTAKITLVMVWDRQTDLRSSVLMQAEMDTLDLREALKNIRQPLLVLGGITSFRQGHSAEEMKKYYRKQFENASNCTLLFSEKGKHFLMWEDADWMWQQMDDFLKRSK